MKKLFIFIILLSGNNGLFAQDAATLQKIDSLENVLIKQEGQEWMATAIYLCNIWSRYGETAEKSIELAQKGIAKLPKNINKNIQHLKNKSSFLIAIASSNNRHGNYELAQEYINQGLACCRLMRPLDRKAAIYKEGRFKLLSSEILYYQRRYKRQIIELQKAAAAFKETGSSYLWAAAMNNTGSAYKYLEQYDSAVYYFKSCDTQFMQYGYAEFLSNQTIIAETLLRKGDYTASDSLYKLVTREGEKDNHPDLGLAYCGLAEIALENKEPEKAIVWLEKAKPLILQSRHTNTIAGLYGLLAKAYEAAKQYEESVLYYKKHNTIYDSIRTTIYGDELIQLQNEFAIDEKNEKIADLESILKKEKRNYLMASLLLLLIIIPAVFWIRKILREKNKSTVIKWTSNDAAPVTTEIHDPFIDSLIDTINNNIGNAQLNVETLAKEMRMSRAQLFSKTKEHFETSPSKLIRQTRLEKAKSLLQEQKLNVSEVAYTVGFKNASHFTRVFKEYFGKSPSEISNES